MNRLKYFSQLETEEFDLCIIGGGATGVGCALDAALRGMKVVLLEKNDFASGTSSKSTKLFHGGVRYLEQAVKKLSMEQFRMVYKALQERRTLINNAPFLAKPLPLLTPCRTWFSGAYYALGLKIYDRLAGTTNLAPSEWLSKEQALKRLPQLNEKGLSSAVLYYDGQFDDARYTIALVKTAAEKGAIQLNHIDIQSFTRNSVSGKLEAAHIRDRIKNKEYTVRAKVFINATGPFADGIRQLANPSVPKRMRVSKGVHLLFPRDILGYDTAILVPKTDDGRVIFMIPWQGRLLVGTTDEECALTEDEIVVEKNDVDYLLTYVNRYLKKPVTRAQIKSGFGGLRPLLQADPSADTKSLVRDHEVEIDPQSGLLSIMGGKWTTYRLMAKDTVDAAEKILRGSVSPCTTDTCRLQGAEEWSSEMFRGLVRLFKVPEYVAKRLCYRYGSDAVKVLTLVWKDGTLRQPLIEGSPILGAEVVYTAVYEMGLSLKDIFSRRLGLELTDWQRTLEAIEPAANLLQDVFWWDEAEKQRQIEQYRNEILTLIKNIGEDGF